MTKITLKQCRYFKTVAQTGGIASAAQVVGISQPAVAQAIAKLEDQTGLVLFRRLHARGMELTAHGVEFLRYAEQMLTYADHMEVAVADIAAHRVGTLRVGCFQSIAPFYLARIVSGYSEKRPGVVLDIDERLQEELVIALGRNEIDLAILYDLGIDDTRFHIWPLVNAHLYLIVPPNHRLAKRDSVSIHEIDGEDFVLFDAPQSSDFFLRVFAKFDIAPKIAFRSSSIESVRSKVAHGLGVSLLSMKPVENTTYDGGQVVPVRLVERMPPTRIVIASHVDAPMNALAEPFVSFCQDLFGPG
ncbi:LysR family transcriptional regulator [uncultured Ruegeria sp.]|uniref:LysR family transcriptional regulator n=1 Tax=uncultured Ruegeria sp. TaxID=259304 RepID=UPI00261FB189|nr:LysR family transcriptional regulator [uncultured Ruegeria sp.]